jgi:hypothetical protein
MIIIVTITPRKGNTSVGTSEMKWLAEGRRTTNCGAEGKEDKEEEEEQDKWRKRTLWRWTRRKRRTRRTRRRKG